MAADATQCGATPTTHVLAWTAGRNWHCTQCMVKAEHLWDLVRACGEPGLPRATRAGARATPQGEPDEDGYTAAFVPAPHPGRGVGRPKGRARGKARVLERLDSEGDFKAAHGWSVNDDPALAAMRQRANRCDGTWERWERAARKEAGLKVTPRKKRPARGPRASSPAPALDLDGPPGGEPGAAMEGAAGTGSAGVGLRPDERRAG